VKTRPRAARGNNTQARDKITNGRQHNNGHMNRKTGCRNKTSEEKIQIKTSGQRSLCGVIRILQNVKKILTDFI
jgi:hypothetical protein